MDRMYRVQVRLPAADGLNKDACVNVWHFRQNDIIGGTTPADSANDMIDQLQNFYEAIRGVYPLTVSAPFKATAFDMNDPEPRVPVLLRDITLSSGPSGEPLPDQVAICLSMFNNVASGESPRRSRGRVYIGPVYQGVATSEDAQAIVATATRTTIINAAHAAFQTVLTVNVPFLCVFSRKDLATGSSLSDSFKTVDIVRVDNRWDIQRRRAEGPTAVSSFDLDPDGRTQVAVRSQRLVGASVVRGDGTPVVVGSVPAGHVWIVKEERYNNVDGSASLIFLTDSSGLRSRRVLVGIQGTQVFAVFWVVPPETDLLIEVDSGDTTFDVVLSGADLILQERARARIRSGRVWPLDFRVSLRYNRYHTRKTTQPPTVPPPGGGCVVSGGRTVAHDKPFQEPVWPSESERLTCLLHQWAWTQGTLTWPAFSLLRPCERSESATWVCRSCPKHWQPQLPLGA